MIKRIFDIAFALAGIIALFPLMCAIAFAIKLTSRGPIFYRGVRTGMYGKPFRIYKFRSMVANAEAVGGTTTGASDSRITHVGHILRRYKLDELPQLFNVLTGTMSLVGPRPEVPEYTERYTDEEQAILSVRPGITDLASLRFNDLQSFVGAIDPDQAYQTYVLPEKNRLRLEYVRRKSFWLDLQILARTIYLVAGKLFSVSVRFLIRSDRMHPRGHSKR